MSEYGFLSLLPPLAAIILAMLTRKTVISLLAGVYLGAIMLAGWNPLKGLSVTVTELLLPALTAPMNIALFVLFIMVGGFVGLLESSGGAYALAEALNKKVTSARRAQVTAWFSSMFIGAWTDASPVIVGPILRPITDRLKVSREKLAYIIDSTAAPMVVNIPFTSWGAFIVSILTLQVARLPETVNPWTLYFGAIPFNFYSIFALLLVGFIAWSRRDYGPMRTAEKRALNSGEVLKGKTPEEAGEGYRFEGGVRPTLVNIFLPLAAFFIVLFGFTLLSGGFPQRTVLEAIQEAEIIVSVILAFMVGGFISGLLMVLRRMAGARQVIGYWFNGVKKVVFIIVIVILAFSIGTLTDLLGTDLYLTGLIDDNIPLFLVPAMVFLASALMAFSTGTSWGVFSIMLPIAFGIGIALDLSMPLVIAAVLSGGITGDHSSPISDTTIISSVGAGCNHIDHVNTQIVYALTAALAALVAFILAGLQLPLPVAWVAGLIIIIVTTLALGRVLEKDKEQAG
jgi:tetracycline resistance efflux pump